MLIFAEKGIDPLTTPSYKKIQMYKVLQGTIIATLTFIMIFVCISLFVDTSYWLSELFYDILFAIIMPVILILFRLRGEEAKGYSMIGDEDAQLEDFDITEIEGLTVQSEQFQRGGRSWTSEDSIPRPVIRETPNVITLESPDGTEEVTVHTGTYNKNETV